MGTWCDNIWKKWQQTTYRNEFISSAKTRERVESEARPVGKAAAQTR